MDSADNKPVLEDPFLVDMPWKSVSVDSSAFRELPPHDRLHGLAHAYLRAATILCERAGSAGKTDWPMGSVCYFNLHHATELFLKACIGRKDPNALKAIHEVGELRKKYVELFPGEHNFFHTPWFLTAQDLAQALGPELLTGIDGTPDQLYRYGGDRGGGASQSIQFFTPGYLFNYMNYLKVHELLESEMARHLGSVHRRRRLTHAIAADGVAAVTSPRIEGPTRRQPAAE